MRQYVWFGVLFVFLVMFPLACGTIADNDLSDEDFLQDNGSLNPESQTDFELLSMFDGRGSLEEIWDSIEADDFNRRLNCTVDNFRNEFIDVSGVAAAVLLGETQPVAGLLSSDLAHLLGFMVDESPYFLESPDDIGAVYTGDPSVYSSGFYSFLDKLWEDDERPGDEQVLEMNRKIIKRLLDKKTDIELEEDMQELVDDIRDDDFDRDFNLVASFLGKLMLQADYPIWTDENGNVLNKVDIDSSEGSTDIDTGTGNAVYGTNTLLNWVVKIMADDSARNLFYDTLRETVVLFDPAEGSENAGKVKNLLQNIEDNFTEGGSVYESDPLYKSGENDAIYDDAELGQTLREFMPYAAQLLARSDRDIALSGPPPEGEAPFYVLREAVKALKQIGFDPDAKSLEESLDVILRHDLLGRDRKENPDAFPASMAESLLFLTAACSNFGFADGGKTGETTRLVIPTTHHGHGAYTEATSLNDSLISMGTYKTLDLLGIYDISLKEDDKDYLSRSNVPFNTGNMDLYKYDINTSYPILRAMPSASSGDYGIPDGGNRTGTPPATNEYYPFNPTGKGETQLSSWTVDWGVRSCFGGEGPYFYEDPDADVVMVDGREYYKYLRPDGRIYALVNKSTDEWEYLYPVDKGDKIDPDADYYFDGVENQPQRFNRYKSTWHSDYYLYHRSSNTQSITVTPGRDADGNLTLIDMEAEGLTDAKRLTYKELIPEDDAIHTRACASPEEAFYRNYQWVYTEKKMVLIIPQSLFMSVPLMPQFGEAFMILEAHGWSGLANMRIFRANHVWAKEGTNGTSLIPGDFRVELAVAATPVMGALVNDETVYNDTLGRGLANPGIVGKNLPALYRFAFPISPKMDRSDEVSDYELGSREFLVDDEDEIWKNRNALAPILVAMLQAFSKDRVEYPEFEYASIKTGLRNHVNSFMYFIKPLVFYSQDDDTTMPTETWKARVQGTNPPDWNGEPYLCSSAMLVDPETMRWDGNDEEWTHYQPKVMKTIFNILVDSDITAPFGEGKRMDGILPVLADTKILTQLFKLFMCDANDSDDLFSALEQITSAITYTEGKMTAINREDGASKPIPFPDRLFVTGGAKDEFGAYTEFSGGRDEDIILDKYLDRLFGHDSLTTGDETVEGYGLAAYVDEQEDPAENWEGFDDTMDTLEDFLHKDSPYSLLESFIDMQDAIFLRGTPYSEEQIKGLVYTLGKMFTRYDADEGRWQVQGEDGFKDLYNILKLRIPAIHDLVKDGSGSNYDVFLNLSLHDMMAEENQCGEKGMVPYLLDTMSTDDGAEQILFDFLEYLGEDFVSEPSPLWTTLANLVSDMATALGETKDLDQVYEDYGFQKN